MKYRNRSRAWVAACVVAFASTSLLSAAAVREFREKEGGRSLQGRIESVDAAKGTVTLRLAGTTRSVTFKQDLLVEEDVTFIQEWARKNALAGRVTLAASRVNGERGLRKVGETYEYRTEEAGFRIAVRNTGNTGTLNEVPVSWHIVVTRANGKTEIVSGSETISALFAGLGDTIETGMVALETSCKSVSSCPTCVDFAKAFEGDRIEGILVELLNEDGESIKDIVTPSTRERRIREAIEEASKKEEKS